MDQHGKMQMVQILSSNLLEIEKQAIIEACFFII